VDPRYLLVISEPDPVAVRVAERWGTPPSTGDWVDGAPIRQLSTGALLLRRSGSHIHDDRLDHRLPTPLRERALPLVFPSVHRSEQNLPCLTVHPLGNPGPTAEVGGEPRTLVPSEPRLMVAALRAMDELGPAAGLRATYEATHHGPRLDSPALFVEIGFGLLPGPPEEAVEILARILPHLEPSMEDHPALGVGGGHYAPHFTDLALRRRWAFGHILSRHALGVLDAATARSALALTPRAEGAVYARASDASLPVLAGIGPRLRDGNAPVRPGTTAPPTVGARRASGT